jgi:hypothetical protein
MLIKPAPDIRSSEITDKVTYLNRRAFIQTAIGGLAIGALAGETTVKAQQPAAHGRKFENIRRSNLSGCTGHAFTVRAHRARSRQRQEALSDQ